jgi:hypothetical protein
VNGAIARFVDDLLDAGICTRRRAVLTLLYDRSLMAGSTASWRRLYRAIFAALQQLSEEPPAPTPRSFAAQASLLRIVEDDLGSEIFGVAAVGRLRAVLVR